ncbi:hypothetical protein ACIBJI_41910 [Nocardia sp. NPDC050408]|uniref:hypothetical protein n=1 Tax=Nocardia sp. NPDC050408 TaxID=3364319 RepID=UPI00379871A1
MTRRRTRSGGPVENEVISSVVAAEFYSTVLGALRDLVDGTVVLSHAADGRPTARTFIVEAHDADLFADVLSGKSLLLIAETRGERLENIQWRFRRVLELVGGLADTRQNDGALVDPDEFERFIRQIREKARAAPLLKCPFHGWTEVGPIMAARCRMCPCPLPDVEEPTRGRARTYCSDACRQRAYRQRGRRRGWSK